MENRQKIAKSIEQFIRYSGPATAEEISDRVTISNIFRDEDNERIYAEMDLSVEDIKEVLIWSSKFTPDDSERWHLRVSDD